MNVRALYAWLRRRPALWAGWSSSECVGPTADEWARFLRLVAQAPPGVFGGTMPAYPSDGADDLYAFVTGAIGTVRVSLRAAYCARVAEMFDDGQDAPVDRTTGAVRTGKAPLVPGFRRSKAAA